MPQFQGVLRHGEYFRPLVFVFLILALGTFAVVQAQTAKQLAWLEEQVIPVTTLDPAQVDFGDLKTLKALIGDAHIVMLGEPTHGDGSAFKAKIRLVQFLHQELGFAKLVFESGIHQAHRVGLDLKEGRPVEEAVLDGIEPRWARSRQVAPLFRYIAETQGDSNPLQLNGMDIRFHLPNTQQYFFPDLERFLSENGVLLPQGYADFKRVALAHIEQPGSVTNRERIGAEEVLKALRASITDVPKRSSVALESPEFWVRTLESLEAELFYFWFDGASRSARFNRRGQQMAENIAWHAKSGKVIVWAATSHIMKAMPSNVVAQMPWASGSNAMGVFLQQATDASIFSLGFTSYKGAYANIRYPGTHEGVSPLPEAPRGSLEHMLHSTGIQYGIVPLNFSSPHGAWLRQTWPSRMLFNAYVKAVWPASLDAIFFIDITEPSMWN